MRAEFHQFFSTIRPALKIHQYALLLTLSLALGGCALSPKKIESRNASDALLAQQFVAVEAGLKNQTPGERTLVFVGSAQHSQSLAFQRDVLLVEQRLKAINPRLQSIILSNQLSSTLTYPFATVETLNHTFKRLSAWSEKYPLTLLVLISTHGNVDVLSSNIANEYFPPVRPSNLRNWLDTLGDTPSTVILSACYSGSFLPMITDKPRIVLTSAAANRNSFGCNYSSDNTYFISALFGDSFDAGKTWKANFDTARSAIEKREQAMRLAPSSNPQHYIPVNVEDKSISELLKP